MAESKNYDDVSQYKLDPERAEELLRIGGECTFIWANKAGHPIGVIMAYVYKDGKIWLTSAKQRVRVPAIRRDGRSSIVVTSKGTTMGGGKTITLKGHTIIHDDNPEVKAWYYPLLAQGVSARGENADAGEFSMGLDPDMFVKFLDTPDRVIMEFTPEMTIPFDGDKMAAATAEAYATFAKENS